MLGSYEEFTSVDAGCAFVPRVEAPASRSHERWWWFCVPSGVWQRFAPCRTAPSERTSETAPMPLPAAS